MPLLLGYLSNNYRVFSSRRSCCCPHWTRCRLLGLRQHRVHSLFPCMQFIQWLPFGIDGEEGCVFLFVVRNVVVGCKQQWVAKVQPLLQYKELTPPFSNVVANLHFRKRRHQYKARKVGRKWTLDSPYNFRQTTSLYMAFLPSFC